jgi:hypothetical protein
VYFAVLANQLESLSCFVPLKIPKGFRQSAQGCEARATLGSHPLWVATLKELHHAASRDKLMQPRWGCDLFAAFTQRSSFLATLG